MPSKPLSADLTAITALGLVAERPRHPYEMQRLIRYRGKTFVRGLPRSLYHAIDRLAKAGLIEAGTPTREGRRPERTVFSITPSGLEELETWLSDLLATPDEHDSAAYSAALSLIAYLSPATATAALRARLGALQLHLTASHAQMTALESMLPRLLMLEEEHRLANIEAERNFTAALVDDLERGTLTWDVDEIRHLAATAQSGDFDFEALRAPTRDAHTES